MNRLALAIVAAGLALGTAQAATPTGAMPQRIRGTLVAASATTLTLRTTSGQTDTVILAPATHFVIATPAKLTDIHTGEFIGSATKSVAGHPVALEVAIFPNAMRGTGEGHYGWDNIPDPTAPGARSGSSMTNGNIAMAVPAAKTGSSMTNGDIGTATTAAGATHITVTYKGGQQSITVPPTATVVRLTPATKAALATPGRPVFVLAAPGHAGLTALAVMVGVGTRLPM